jgi:hypothetical protein
LQVQLDDQKVQLDVSDKVREWLVENGYDKNMGARPMQRLIQESIKKVLAEEILFGKLSKNGGVAIVDIVENKIQVKYRENNKNALEIKRKLYDTKKIQHALAEWKIGNPEPFWNLRLPFIKGRAKQQKLPFNLTTENMTALTYRQRFLCYYTNFLLISFAGKGAKSKSIEERMHTLSIDKMDPLKGYTIDNVVLVSDFINTMKLNLTNHEFLTLINTIVRQFAGKEVSYNRIHKFYNTNQKKFKKFKNIITNKKNIQKMVKNVFLGRKEAREYYPDIKSFEDIRKKF